MITMASNNNGHRNVYLMLWSNYDCQNQCDTPNLH